MCIFLYTHTHTHTHIYIYIYIYVMCRKVSIQSILYVSAYIRQSISYGVATIRRLLKIIGLFCKRAL